MSDLFSVEAVFSSQPVILPFYVSEGSTVAQKPLQLPLADKLNILFALTDEIYRAVTNIDFLCWYELALERS